jgi:hypothetical protein
MGFARNIGAKAKPVGFVEPDECIPKRQVQQNDENVMRAPAAMGRPNVGRNP